MDKNKGGRPQKEFDRDLFESLCGIMCTEEEICAVLHTSDKTLSGWCKRVYGSGFSETQKRFSNRGKVSLRRYQFNLAKKNASMAIFLGKNYLGQKDSVEYEDTKALEKLDEILKATETYAESETK